MSCLYPKFGVLLPRADGKKYMRFIGQYDPRRKFVNHIENDIVKIPCGKCIQCRLSYSRDWATRMLMESRCYAKDEVWMVTLTYDDDHLPTWKCSVWDKDMPSPALFDSHPVVKRDLQLFLKRFRKSLGVPIKFFACGEYGEKNNRPHYHVVVFGWKPDKIINDPVFSIDRKYNFYLQGYSHSGFPLYFSPLLAECWSAGRCMVSPFTWECAAYVARYMLKKQMHDDKYYMIERGLTPSFVTMSGGLGREYMELNFDDLLEIGSFSFLRGDKVVHVPLPRYFFKLAEKYGVDFSQLRSAQYRDTILNDELKVDNVGLTWEQFISQEEDRAFSVDKRLVRPM